MNRFEIEQAMKDFKPGLLTRAISHVSPIRAEKRVAAEYRSYIRERVMSGEMSGTSFGSYDAAGDTRLRTNWNPGNGSPDYSTLSELEKLRARSSDLVRNNPFASSILQTYDANIVSTGITAQPVISPQKTGLSEDAARQLSEDAQNLYEEWAEVPDYSDRYSWLEIQKLAIRGAMEMGDIFGIPRIAKNRRTRLETRIQLIEADRVRTPFIKERQFKDEDIRDGISIDPDSGEPLRIYVSNSYKQDYGKFSPITTAKQKYEPVPYYDSRNRRNVYHLMCATRPGLSRGVPMFHSSMLLFDDLSKYLEAELTAARVAACFSVFIKKLDPSGAASGNLFSTTETERLETVEPGMIEYLDVNEDISSFSPQRPSSTFEGFVSRLLKTIASASGVPYELVAKDFSGVNYSSARIALLQSYRHFRTLQLWMTQKLLQPIYERVMEEAYLKGLWGQDIPLAQWREMRREFTRCAWTPDGWEWVDPLKEAQAEILALENNVNTLADITSARGKNWQDVLEQRAREKQTAKKLGIEEQADAQQGSTQSGGGGSQGAKSVSKENRPSQNDSIGSEVGDRFAPVRNGRPVARAN